MVKNDGAAGAGLNRNKAIGDKRRPTSDVRAFLTPNNPPFRVFLIWFPEISPEKGRIFGVI